MPVGVWGSLFFLNLEKERKKIVEKSGGIIHTNTAATEHYILSISNCVLETLWLLSLVQERLSLTR